jgi:hypothetical protein
MKTYPDDNEPITREWLRSIGVRGNDDNDEYESVCCVDGRTEIRGTPGEEVTYIGYSFADEQAYIDVTVDNHTRETVLLGPRGTRGEMRLLFRALKAWDAETWEENLEQQTNGKTTDLKIDPKWLIKGADSVTLDSVTLDTVTLDTVTLTGQDLYLWMAMRKVLAHCDRTRESIHFDVSWGERICVRVGAFHGGFQDNLQASVIALAAKLPQGGVA